MAKDIGSESKILVQGNSDERSFRVLRSCEFFRLSYQGALMNQAPKFPTNIRLESCVPSLHIDTRCIDKDCENLKGANTLHRHATSNMFI